MALEVDGELVLSALLVIVIVSLLTYIFFHHHKHLTNNMALEVGCWFANLNTSTGSTSTSAETLRPPTSSLLDQQSEAVGGEAQDNHVANQDKLDLDLLEKLKITMSSINKVIDYAEKKETTDPSVKPLLHKLKDAVYDAEDLLDVISFQTHENEVSTTTPWNPFVRSLQKELEDVFGRVQFLSGEIRNFGLLTRSNSTSETFRPPTTSLVEKSCVYGRDDDKEKIKKLLLSNDDGSNGDVIAIVGMGGVGKTTLAQLVFDDYEINRVFKSNELNKPNKVWICVAEDFDVIKITKTILEKLTSQSYTTNDFDELQRKLRETLLGKRFLIALDDVWNENYSNWDNLRKPFASAAPGSKIIVTTRSERVAAAMHVTSTYKLKPLLDEACWLLFSKHAFKNIKPNSYSTFEALGRELVKKCGGLPLAAKVLGGLVGTKQSYEEWQEVLKSEIWDLSDEASDNNILSVLRLSYHYLPSNLKRCFAFCSIVPKDYDFEREKLVLLWMTENLLSDSKIKRRRIDVGYEYLRELESRSLIQPSRLWPNQFSMHNLVNDLAKFVSREFYKSFGLENSFNGGEKTRHFSYEMTSDVYDPTRFKEVSKAKRLRTFLPLVSRYAWEDVSLTPQLCSEIWLQLNVLRSLTLTHAGIEKLSDSIGNLKLLRYLDLSCNRKLNQLPESVASLFNLEVLNLSDCRCLSKLPSKMRQLTKLIYLNIKYTTLEEMPLQMGRLKDLDVLTNFVVGKGSGSSVGELKELKYLRGELHIHGLENITHPEDALEANLNGKSYLEELYLDFSSGSEDGSGSEDALEANLNGKSYPEELYLDFGSGSEDARILLENLRPHVNLKKLSIIGYSGTRLPDWLGKYNSVVNLVDIRVFGFEHCFDLSPLGQLPSLESLSIERCDSLVTLIPVELPNEIHHHVGHYFSALVKLEIQYCPKLKLPQQNHCFTSLEDFSLGGGSCASLEFLPVSLFPKLKTLDLADLESIESLSVIDEANNFNLQYMESIFILSCPKLKFFSVSLFPNLKMLDLKNLESIESLAVIDEANNFDLQYLESIYISTCPKLKFFPVSLFPNLKDLRINGCNKLMANRSNWSLQKMRSLSTFEIRNFECDDLESFPEERLLPSSLSTLEIVDVPNLTNLNGKSFQLLTSLETLQLWDCPKLQCLPEQGLPTSLSTLQIRGCPLLESRCQRQQGEDWSKIAHLPNIWFSPDCSRCQISRKLMEFMFSETSFCCCCCISPLSE